MNGVPYPIPTGNLQRDVLSVMQWIQQQSQPFFSDRIKVRAAATPTVLTPTDRIVRLTVTADHDAVTLPPATVMYSGGSSYLLHLTKADASGNGFRITPPSGTINGAAYLDVTAQYSTKTVYSDGTNYFAY